MGVEFSGEKLGTIWPYLHLPQGPGNQECLSVRSVLRFKTGPVDGSIFPLDKDNVLIGRI